MSRVQALKEATTSFSVKFLEFTRVASKDPSITVCFFEGKDEKYYSSRLTDNLGDFKWHGIDSGGKKVVLEVFETISKHSTYSSSRALYFIDRDFEIWFSNPDPKSIYVTPCYSVENLYVSETALVRILSSEFGVTEFNDNREGFRNCIKLFREFKKEVGEALYEFNCWVMAHRLMERDGRAPSSINVRNVKTEDLVSVSFSGVYVKYDKNDPASPFRDHETLSLCPLAIKEAKDYLSLDQWPRQYRGKQVIDFFRSFLMGVKQDISQREPTYFKKRSKVHLSLSKEQIISELLMGSKVSEHHL